MKFVLALTWAALASPAIGFAPPRSKAGGAARTADTSLFLEPGELTDYMAKAHEQKLKAIREAEEKKEQRGCGRTAEGDG